MSRVEYRRVEPSNLPVEKITLINYKRNIEKLLNGFK